jgi:hypothetical protein
MKREDLHVSFVRDAICVGHRRRRPGVPLAGRVVEAEALLYFENQGSVIVAANTAWPIAR